MLSPPVIRKPRPQNYVLMPRTGGIIIIIITLEIITYAFSSHYKAVTSKVVISYNV